VIAFYLSGTIMQVGGAVDAIPDETLLQAVAQWHSLPKDKEHSHL
jgi:hypothetical protein